MKSAPPRAISSSLEELLNGSAINNKNDSPSRAPARPSETARPARTRRAGLVARIVCIAALLLAVAATGWWVSGGRWMIVATPSMGQAAPVGTLVFTEHVTTSDVRVGDVVSFHSPINLKEIYTHRVVSVDTTGGLHTRGDINGAEDPWTLHTKDLVGKVVARWWGIGWLIRGLPFLLVGGAVLWLITRRFVAAVWRLPLRVFGASVLVSIAAYLLKPFVNVVVVSTTSVLGSSSATIVSTGLLPIRVSATGGAHLDLVDGQIGAVAASGTPGPHGYQFSSALHLSLPWWIALVLIWISPLLLSLLFSSAHALPPEDRGPGGSGTSATWAVVAASAVRQQAPAVLRTSTLRTSTQSRGRHRGVAARSSGASSRRHRLRPRRGVVGFTLAFAAFLGFVPATESAFAAKITNSNDTAATATYFTCRSASAATTANGGYVAYPLNEVAPFAAATDANGARNGTYTTNLTGTVASSSSAPCPRDLPSRAVTFNSGLAALGAAYVAGGGAVVVDPEVFSEEIWFKTSTAGGRLIGFGVNNLTANTGVSTSYDRHIYMSTNGQLNFGVYPNGGSKIITSPLGYADGLWHQVVATLSSAGMVLYVDGASVVSDPATKSAQIFSGYWRVGYDNLTGWTNGTTNGTFNGTLAWASVYTTALSATQVQEHYRAGIA